MPKSTRTWPKTPSVTQADALNERALPLAQERVSLTLSSYEAGRGDLGAVLASRKELVETRLRAIELAAQQALSRVRLNTLLVKEQP